MSIQRVIIGANPMSLAMSFTANDAMRNEMNHSKTLEETRRHWHSRIVALGLTKDEFTLMAGVSSSVWYAGDMKLSTAKKIEDKLKDLENEIKS